LENGRYYKVQQFLFRELEVCQYYRRRIAETGNKITIETSGTILKKGFIRNKM